MSLLLFPSNDICTATADGTVQFVVDSLWYHHDDCTDHLAGLSKLELHTRIRNLADAR